VYKFVPASVGFIIPELLSVCGRCTE